MSSIFQLSLQSFLNFTINVTGFLAGAGVLGLAVGFGAQSLVKDLLLVFSSFLKINFQSGIMFKLELTVGTVEEIGLTYDEN